MDVPSLFASLGFSALAVALILFIALALSAYVKIVTVLSVLRIGLGAGSLPTAFVTGSLAVALTFFVMYPTMLASTSAMDAVVKQKSGAVNDQLRADALNAGLREWKNFLITHAHEKEVERFRDIAVDFRVQQVGRFSTQQGKLVPGGPGGKDSWQVVVPAFLVSELKEAFATGLSLFLPFLVIDLLIANTLVAVGLERMSPGMVSFPFKLLLFVMVDGWALITSNLVGTYV